MVPGDKQESIPDSEDEKRKRLQRTWKKAARRARNKEKFDNMIQQNSQVLYRALVKELISQRQKSLIADVPGFSYFLLLKYTLDLEDIADIMSDLGWKRRVFCLKTHRWNCQYWVSDEFWTFTIACSALDMGGACTSEYNPPIILLKDSTQSEGTNFQDALRCSSGEFNSLPLISSPRYYLDWCLILILTIEFYLFKSYLQLPTRQRKTLKNMKAWSLVNGTWRHSGCLLHHLLCMTVYMSVIIVIRSISSSRSCIYFLIFTGHPTWTRGEDLVADAPLLSSTVLESRYICARKLMIMLDD